MHINPTSKTSFTSYLMPIQKETFIRGAQAVTIREANSIKDITKVAKAMTKAYFSKSRLRNNLLPKKERLEGKFELKSINKGVMNKTILDYLKDILSVDDKTSVLMVEDNYNKNKLVGYAIMHSKDDKTAIIEDMNMEYNFRESFGFYLIHNITKSAKNIYERILTRRFPVASPSNPEYEDLGYKLVKNKENESLNSEYFTETFPYYWMEKNL